MKNEITYRDGYGRLQTVSAESRVGQFRIKLSALRAVCLSAAARAATEKNYRAADLLSGIAGWCAFPAAWRSLDEAKAQTRQILSSL